MLLAAAAYAAVFFARPINLATADLGRHLTNGKLLLAGVTDVLFLNFYSYTEPAHAFINHHWGTGIIFHLAHEGFGFDGLSVLYIALSLLALGLLFAATRLRSGWQWALLSTVLMIPLLANRAEVRPEGFSYALIGLNLWIWQRHRSEKTSFKTLLSVLIPVQLLWVNLHIFFFIGPMIAGLQVVDKWLIQQDREGAKRHSILLLLLIAVSIVNPHHISGLLTPLTIFEEYGYMVAENQPLWFMMDRFPRSVYWHFIILGTAALAGIFFLWKNNELKHFAVETVLALFGLVLGIMAVRGIPLFALFGIPLLAASADRFMQARHFRTRQRTDRLMAPALLVFCLVFLMIPDTPLSARDGSTDIGVIPESDQCGTFLKRTGIGGPIFNNYDFGSYLIHHLHDRKKVFVDNRPEAYPVAFFDSIYRPMQENEDDWKRRSEEFGFNAIVFYRLDNTSWAQPFLIRRTQDPEWVPVYVDAVSIVLIRNAVSNAEIISRYAIPRSTFSGVPYD